MLKEFKKFAMKGNVVDLAVGVVIGTAFGKIVSSFVADIIMPPIGAITRGVDFSEFAITIKKASKGAEAITMNYGAFLNTIIDFAIIAFAIFIVIKQLNRFNKKEEKKPAKVSEEAKILKEIRDELKKN